MTVSSDIGPWALIPRWVRVALLDSGSGALPLYAELADRADRTDQSWTCSRAELAEALHVSVSTIKRWQTELRAVGAIEVTANQTQAGDQGWNTYRVVQAQTPVGPAVDPGRSTGEPGSVHGWTPSTRTPNQEPLIKHSSASAAQNAGVRPEWLDSFAMFWSCWPKGRKVDRVRAERAWKALTKTDRQAALAALPVWVPVWAQQESRFIPHPTTWLHGRRWEDDAPTVGVDPVPWEDAWRQVTARAERFGRHRWDDSEHPGWVPFDPVTVETVRVIGRLPFCEMTDRTAPGLRARFRDVWLETAFEAAISGPR